METKFLGLPEKETSQLGIASRALKEMAITAKGTDIDRHELIQAMVKLGLAEDVAEKMVGKLYAAGRIYETKPSKFRVVGYYQ